MNLGDKIRSIRIDKDITMAELAEKTNTTVAAISRYELGQREPKLDMIGKIAKALNVPIFDLMDMDAFMDGFRLGALGQDLNFKRITMAFDTMNEDGQKKAADNVEDLAKVPEYQKEKDNAKP